MIDSSPSSAKSNFRELDEVFLQSQTRIWLGEVLSTRLDEDLPMSDLLQDGEILFEVSKVVWNLLSTKSKELRHLKHKYGPFGSKKSSGRYRPYSNVDSFLKICKILGLSGIDLFSPSDVVEKRDVRKVCICIRALSKKARSKHLSVPDFDMVIYSVAMPTDMVGIIRRSLESSQCTISSSSSYSSRRGSQEKLKQKTLHATSNRDDDSSSEESDEAESRYMGENSFSPAGKFNYADGVNSSLEYTPDAYPISRKNLYNGNEGIHKCTNGTMSASNILFTPENDDSIKGDSSCSCVGDNGYISDYLAFSDLMVHASDGSNSVIHDGQNNMFDFFLNIDNQRSFQNRYQRKLSDDEEMEVSSTTSMTSVLGRLLNLEFDDQFDEDNLSSANVSSSESKEFLFVQDNKDSFTLSEPLKIDTFRTQLDTVLFDSQQAQSEMAPTVPSHCSSQKKCELSGMECLAGESNFCPEKEDLACEDANETVRKTMGSSDSGLLQDGDDQSSDVGIHISEVKPDCLKFSPDSKSFEESEGSKEEPHKEDVQSSSIHGIPMVASETAEKDLHETISDNHSGLPVEYMNRAREDSSQGKTENSLNIPGDTISDGRKDTSPPRKHARQPLLKTVVKGTAIAGVLFLLLQISKSIRSRGNNVQETKQQARVSKHNGSQFSSTKRQTRRVGKGVYPSERIKLGN